MKIVSLITTVAVVLYLCAVANAASFNKQCLNVTVEGKNLYEGVQFDNTGVFTYMFWIKTSQAPTGNWRGILHKGNNDGERGPGFWWYPSEMKLHARLSLLSDWNSGCDPAYTFTLNKWEHVAYVYNKMFVSVYINGVQASQCSAPSMSVNTGPLRIGGFSSSHTGTQLADIIVNESVLDINKIKEAFNGQKYTDCDEAGGSESSASEEAKSDLEVALPLLGTWTIKQQQPSGVQVSSTLEISGKPVNFTVANAYLLKTPVGQHVQGIMLRVGSDVKLTEMVPSIKGTFMESFGFSASAALIFTASTYREPLYNNIKMKGPGFNFVADFAIKGEPFDTVGKIFPLPTRTIIVLSITTSTLQFRFDIPFNAKMGPLKFAGVFFEASAGLGGIFSAIKGPNDKDKADGKDRMDLLSPSISVGVSIEFTPSDKDLIFITGRLTFGLKDASGSLSMEGMWNDVLGIKGLSIGNLGFELVFNYAVFSSTGLPSGLGFTGQIQVGKSIARIAIKANFDLTELGFYASLNRLTLHDVIDFVNGIISTNGKPVIPKAIIPEIGIYDVEVLFAPKKFSIGEFVFKAGFKFKGQFQITHGDKVLFFFMIDFEMMTLAIPGGYVIPTGITAAASMSSINLLDIIKIYGAGMDRIFGTADDGPTISLTLSLSKQEFYVSGAIDFLGIRSETWVYIARDGVSIKFELKIWDLFLFRVEGGIVGSGNTRDFILEVTYNERFVNYIMDKVKEATTKFKELATKKLNEAKTAVNNNLNADKEYASCTSCPAGYTWSATLCLEDCKPNETTVALNCQTTGCASDQEKDGLLCYFPKCRSGYNRVASVCWQQDASYGRGVGTVPDWGDCGSKQNDAGLCYNYCKSGYHGVGPVCWRDGPLSYIEGKSEPWLKTRTKKSITKIGDCIKWVVKTAVKAIANAFLDFAQIMSNVVADFAYYALNTLLNLFRIESFSAKFSLRGLINDLNLGDIKMKVWIVGQPFDLAFSLNLKDIWSFIKQIFQSIFSKKTGKTADDFGDFTMLSKATGKCLEATSGQVQAFDCVNSKNAQRFFWQGEWIKNKQYPDKCLGIQNAVNADGARFVMVDCEERSEQKWYRQGAESIRSRLNNRAIDAPENKNGGLVHTWSYDASNVNQKFVFVPVEY